MILTAEQHYHECVASTRSKLRIKSLSAIKEACNLLEKVKAPISVAQVAKLCPQGPKEQSINNQSQLSHYVQLRRTEQKLPKVANGEITAPFIADLNVRAYVGLLQGELKDTKENLSRIMKGVKTMAPLSVVSIIGGQSGERRVPAPTSRDPVLAACLRKILTAEHLEKFGLVLSKQRIRDATTLAIFIEKDELEAIQSFLEA
jgi:hypothetical protein